MQKSTITIDVQLDDNKVPQQISWKASDSAVVDAQQAKAMMIAFWDGADKSALRVDLWTKEMMVDEMAEFYYQIFMGMAESYDRATHDHSLVEEIKKFAQSFQQKFKELQLKENKI